MVLRETPWPVKTRSCPGWFLFKWKERAAYLEKKGEGSNIIKFPLSDSRPSGEMVWSQLVTAISAVWRCVVNGGDHWTSMRWYLGCLAQKWAHPNCLVSLLMRFYGISERSWPEWVNLSLWLLSVSPAVNTPWGALERKPIRSHLFLILKCLYI